ncbi:MAG: polysaccharide deacetylase family protein [Thermoanaerobaculia bacterium]|nr:polysaccharide deacetylase family protein [Thermoanaerobaculia bacterium]
MNRIYAYLSVRLLWLLILGQAVCLNTAHSQSLQERLGYPADAKLLILHADDLGMSHAENQASFEGLLSGAINSASIMVPCPWLTEAATFARGFAKADMGLHLTLTSEWKYYKWGPTAPRNAVSSLLDSLGYFYADCATLAAHARPEEVEIELRAQIEKAKAMGIQPTHLDSHMGCLFFTRPEFFQIYLKLGREYQIPAMLGRDMLTQLPAAAGVTLSDKDVVVDRVLTASPEDYKGGMAAYYERTLRALQPGVSVLLMHLAYEGPEMRAMTQERPDWGAAWRQADFDFFTGDTCRKILAEEGIQLITWKELGKLMK